MPRVRASTELGALARAARTRHGWSQQQAADAAGVSRRFVNMMEGGHHPNAELWRVLALLDAVGVELHANIPAGDAKADEGSDAGTDRPSVIERPAVLSPDGFDLDAHLSGFRGEREER